MNEGTEKLPLYRCHKMVRAAKISLIVSPRGSIDDVYWLHLADGRIPYTIVRVLAGWVVRHNPEVGGYYVRYEDRYESYSPAKAFEEGYSRVDQADKSNDKSNDIPFLPRTASSLIRDALIGLIDSMLLSDPYSPAKYGELSITAKDHDGKIAHTMKLDPVRYKLDKELRRISRIDQPSRIEPKSGTGLAAENGPVAEFGMIGQEQFQEKRQDCEGQEWAGQPAGQRRNPKIGDSVYLWVEDSGCVVPRPAIVTCVVESGKVDLFVMDRLRTLGIPAVPYGIDPGQWSWPGISWRDGLPDRGVGR